MRANLRSIAEAASLDPKLALLNAAGPMTDYEVFHNLVLVATYIPPERTKGGIILSDRSLAESRFQGKMGLVLKVGPQAFKDDARTTYGGVTVEPGDWILYRASDGLELFIKDWTGTSNDGLSCRLIDDILIKGRVTDPSLIY